MRGVVVALDLETTGLNKDEDAIIEIGAARFEDGQLVDTFSQLVNPERYVPERVTALTGIENAHVLGAPRIHEVLPALQEFIGLGPLIGHRIDFDLGFLNRYGVALTNVAIDTYDLAAVMLPTTARYNLTHLTQLLGLELEHAHRALDDAQATGYLYWELWRRILAMPYDTLDEIVRASEQVDWNARPVFMEALQERARSVMTEGKKGSGGAIPAANTLFRRSDERWEVLRPYGDPRPLEVNKLADIIDAGGRMSQVFPGYEHRPQQVDMLRSVVLAFNEDQHMMIEAPTGVGKSMAYLIPAIYWAALNNERVVVSTATINLQDQLIQHDLPLLAEALDIPFRAAVLKGRANYLCPRRLTTLRRRGPTSIGEMRVLAKILVWLLESDSGDKGEISLRGFEENAAWARLSAEDEGCTIERCGQQMGGTCPFYQARRRAEAAHILVVNHALLLSDVQIGSRVLPDYRYLIIDEAHHLEEATTNGLSFQINRITLQRQIRDLGTAQRGLLGDVIRGTRGSVPPEYFGQVAEYVDVVSAAVQAMGRHADSYFDVLYSFAESTNQVKPGEYTSFIRVTSDLRQQYAWNQVLEAWDVLSQFTQGIADAMKKLARALQGLSQFDVLDYDDLLSSVRAASMHFSEVHERLGAFSTDPQEDTIYWIEVSQDRERLSVHTAPLNVGPLLDKYIWQAKQAVILTSATLRTGGTFDYMRDRLEARDVDDVVVGSPFDYEESTLVYIPTDMPSPDQRDSYQRYVERGLIELAAATDGRLLGLFTSYAQLRQTAQAITPRLALGNITVFDQSDGTSRQSLLDGFKSTQKSVLLGTRSFWEGVDIPGDDLSVLVIMRLPFAVPSDPVFAARSELYENSFMQYAVPDAILRFRQGFGRLIRTKTDRGVVALFDNRVITKRYGQMFLDSLPPCTVQRGPLADLPRVAVGWLRRD